MSWGVQDSVNAPGQGVNHVIDLFDPDKEYLIYT